MSLTLGQEPVQDGVLAIRAKGEIDHHSFEMFDDFVTELIEDGQAKIIVDLGAVTYISSSGLASLVGLMNKALGCEEGAFVLFGLRPEVREIFDTMGFSVLLQIVEKQQEALDLIQEQS